MSKLLYTITWDGDAPTIKQVSSRYGLNPDEIDQEFGVILIDPDIHRYSIMIEETAALRLQGQSQPNPIEGPYANPRIEPFGPPTASPDHNVVKPK
jgi:hypothetical protein